MDAVCAGIVLYNPDIARLRRVLDALIPQVNKAILVDNGSDDLTCVSALLDYYESVTFIRLGENRGIAAALNIICESARADGFRQVLTLDQDTVVGEDMVSELASHTGKRIGIVCPRVLYEGNEDFETTQGKGVEAIEWAITSGSLTSLEAWEDVGGFDELMFIDGVDRDFCLRLGKKGWTVRRVNGAVMHHQLGELRCRKVFGRTVYATNHPAWRRYYMARNRVYLCRKGLVRASETADWLLKETVKVLLFERGGSLSRSKSSRDSGTASTWRHPDGEIKECHDITGQTQHRSTVAVLLSTYNGAKYLEELLDSVFSQQDVEIHLFVRDDGSSDNTTDILKRYQEAHANMTLRLGQNIGVIASFNELIRQLEVAKYDYVAFCDQDDVWLADKLSTAVSMLIASENSSCPIMYCSNLTIVNESLEAKGQMRRQGIALTKEGVLVQNVGTGCTEVFNQKARDLYLLGIGSSMEMHDYWMTLVCIYMGKIIYDDASHILYRQHSGNVIGVRKYRMKTALRNMIYNKSSKRTLMLKDFTECYEYQLSERDKAIIANLVDSGRMMSAKIRVFFSKKYVSYDPRVTVGFKLRTIAGRMY